LDEFRAYVALASYPIIIALVFSWWGEGTRWATENRSFSMPPELLRKEKRTGRFLFFFKYGLLLLALRFLVGKGFWRTIFLIFQTHSALILIVWGAAGGALVFACRRLLASISRTIAETEAGDDLLAGPVALWLMIFAFGAFAEEFWRALCISAFQHNGSSAITAVLWPACAFAAAHLSGLPPRIPGGLENVIPELGVGLIFGLLFVLSGSLLPATVASMVYYTSNLFWLRRHYQMYRSLDT
jgi:hypothetical protein